MEEYTDIGKYLKIPTKRLLRDKNTPMDPFVRAVIKDELIRRGRNFIPVIVEECEDSEDYRILFNDHIYIGAIAAELDFVWCIIADQDRQSQVEVESLQRFHVDLMTASEELLRETFDYIRDQYPSCGGQRGIQSEKAAKEIIAKRDTTQWQNCTSEKRLKKLTTLKCGIGEKKLPLLARYFGIDL